MTCAAARPDATSAGVRSVRTYTLLALTVLLNSLGNFLLSVGMKHVGEVRSWSIWPLLGVLARALTTGAILTGIASLVLFYILHLLPVRDAIGFLVACAAHVHDRVEWRGREFYLVRGRLVPIAAGRGPVRTDPGLCEQLDATD